MDVIRVMLAHQEGTLMAFIIVDSKMGSISGCCTSISDMKKKPNKHSNIPKKDTANLNQNLISDQKSLFI